jgi:hypothetical protein
MTSDTRAQELLEAATAVVNAHEAVRNAINGDGHPDEDHDDVLGDILYADDEVVVRSTIDGCSMCAGRQYGAEIEENEAFGRLRAELGLEVRPWESFGADR